jgi:hypothetical protein
MTHSHTPGATSREVGTIARLTMVESRAVDPSDRLAIAEGLELIRRLVAERGLHRDLAEIMDDARADSFCYDPPCPDE